MIWRMTLLSGLLAGVVASGALAATATRAEFGKLADGRSVEAVTLTGGSVSVKIITYGASIQSVMTPDRDGKPGDITLGYAKLQDYIDNPQYFGATVGRYANRIAKGRFVLDGRTYQLPVNNGANSLHGGTAGFDKVLWSVDKIGKGSVTLSYVSPDGDQDYPGALTAKASYTLDDNGQLTVEYTAKTDKPTIVNLTNHAYWNLSGEGTGSVMDQILTIPGAETTPVDAGLIPTGSFAPVAGPAFDFRTPKPIGRDIRDGSSQQLLFGKGFDHNWVIARAPVATPRLVAKVEDPKSGRVIEISSTMPGLQFYSGNFLDGTVVGKSGRFYRQGDAFALEPQLFPDTPNHPEFGSARLEPGHEYRHTIVYRFTVAP
jgi:aldose 1-epimerase